MASSPRGSLRLPLRCGDGASGYTHILAEPEDHGDPLADPAFDNEVTLTLQQGAYLLQANGNPRWSRRYSEDESPCRRGAWGFRVVAALPPRADGQPIGIVSAFYLSAPPAQFP